jgi:SAM-dependent methyltransferase
MINVAEKLVAALARVRRRRALSFLARTGTQTGTPVMRYYWDRFCDLHRDVFRGKGIEIDTDATTRKYGAKDLEDVDILNIAPGDRVNVVADLCAAWNVPSDSYDIFVNQFTLHVVSDDLSALYHSLRILRPGGGFGMQFSLRWLVSIDRLELLHI